MSCFAQKVPLPSDLKTTALDQLSTCLDVELRPREVNRDPEILGLKSSPIMSGVDTIRSQRSFADHLCPFSLWVV